MEGPERLKRDLKVGIEAAMIPMLISRLECRQSGSDGTICLELNPHCPNSR